MTSSKRFRQSLLTREKNFATSASALVGTPITPTASISQTTETLLNISNHSESSQVNQLIRPSVQNDRLSLRKSSLREEQLELTTTDKNKQTVVNVTQTIVEQTQSATEDDWVCPVAVALRRAGYNVPLRPSKSWLERDRKKQALLREREASSKEM